MKDQDRTNNVADAATEQSEAVRALLRERNRAQQYLDVAAVIMVVLDKDGNITLFEPKRLRNLGVPGRDTPW